MYKDELRELNKVAKSTEMIWCIVNSEKAAEGEITQRNVGTIKRHIDKIETIICKMINGPTVD